MNTKKTALYGIVHFQRQVDAAPDFVRVGEVKGRVDAIAKARLIIPGLTELRHIKGVELKRVSLELV